MAKKYKKKHVQIYCLYRGDEFVDVGSAEELAEKFGCTISSIYQKSCPTNKNRDTNGKRLLAYKLVDDGELG